MKKIKIKIHQEHFAYISSDLLREFHAWSQVVNMTSFIKKSFYNQFGLYINSAEDIKKADCIVEKCFYQDKSEWLREIMRNEIKKHKEAA